MKAFAGGFLACSFFAALIPARAQEIYGDASAPIAGKVLGTIIHTLEVEELRYVILKRLTDRYADDKGITVTQAEKDAYVKQVQDRMKEDRERQEARRDELTRKLADSGLSAAERESLASELDRVNKFIAALAETGGEATENPEEVKAARDQVAAAFIRQWKINRALYQQYGGRIIFQQGGPEPLDAYRRFLEERQAQGEFEILNKDLEPPFWHYYRTDAIHSFFPPGSKEEAQAFESPPWQSK